MAWKFFVEPDEDAPDELFRVDPTGPGWPAEVSFQGSPWRHVNSLRSALWDTGEGIEVTPERAMEIAAAWGLDAFAEPAQQNEQGT
jgi:hypothetical protein